jgi:hypothetical protein
MQHRKKYFKCPSVIIRGYCNKNLRYSKLSFCLHIINPHAQRITFSILLEVAVYLSRHGTAVIMQGPLRRYTCRLEDNIKIYLQETEEKGVDLNHLTGNWDKWWALVSAVMNNGGSLNSGNS